MSFASAVTDCRALPISGATPAALAAFERALAVGLSWRAGAEHEIELALREAPEFVMAHVLRAHPRLSSRDPALLRALRPRLARAEALRANDRERMHLAAIAAVLDDDYERAKALLGEIGRGQPRDIVALQAAHALDYVTGDLARLGDRIADALPAWSRDLPGYHALLAMQAFGLEERGEYARAEELAHAALALEPFDARAHHVLAHVLEMTGRADAGLGWMHRHAGYWSEGTIVATHGWWHVALFHLARGERERALAVYDRRVRAGDSTEVSDLIDAAALLWRIDLRGGDHGARWRELAAAWDSHIDDAFCTFNDLHAMIAFVGAGDWSRARRLERVLEHGATRLTRYGVTTRRVGMPACRALTAFGRGDHRRAIALLRGLPGQAQRIGGSEAQRGLLDLTLRAAVERLARRRIAVRPATAATSGGLPRAIALRRAPAPC